MITPTTTQYNPRFRSKTRRIPTLSRLILMLAAVLLLAELCDAGFKRLQEKNAPTRPNTIRKPIKSVQASIHSDENGTTSTSSEPIYSSEPMDSFEPMDSSDQITVSYKEILSKMQNFRPKRKCPKCKGTKTIAKHIGVGWKIFGEKQCPACGGSGTDDHWNSQQSSSSDWNRHDNRRLAASCSVLSDHDAPHGLFILVPILLILILTYFFLRKATPNNCEKCY